jgi:uncharacterized protein
VLRFTAVPQDDPVLKRFVANLDALRPRVRKIVLFGSRARGDANPWSDYDVLILVDRRDQSLVDSIYDLAVEIQADTGSDLSLKIMAEVEWDRRQRAGSSLVANVSKEGVVLG